MNALERFANKVYEHTEDECDRLTLALAYLQLHRNNPGLHPDNYSDPEGGYCGWHVLLVDKVWTRFSGAPDGFRYPGFIVGSCHAVKLLEDFHASDETDDLKDQLDMVKVFLDNMSEEDMPKCVNALERLLTFHADAPNEVFAPLYEFLEVLYYLS